MNAKTRYMTLAMAVLAAITTVGCQDEQNGASAWVGRQRSDSLKTRDDATDGPMSDEILPETYVAAGRLHESHHRLARAAQQYRIAIELEHDNVEAHNRLGVVLDKLGRYPEADETFQQAIRLAPGQAYLYNNLGFSYTLQQRWAEAEEVFQRALEIQPDFARARVNLAMCLAHLERWHEALHEFELAVPREDAYYNLGLLYQTKRRLTDAASAYRTALVLNPNLSAARKRFDMLPADIQAKAVEFHIVAGAQPAEMFTIANDTSYASGQQAAENGASSSEPALIPIRPAEDEPEMQVLSAQPTDSVEPSEPQFDPPINDPQPSMEADPADESAQAMIPTPAEPTPIIVEDPQKPALSWEDDLLAYATESFEAQEDGIEATSATQPAEVAAEELDKAGDPLVTPGDEASSDSAMHGPFKQDGPQTGMTTEPTPEVISDWKTFDWNEECIADDSLSSFFRWLHPFSLTFLDEIPIRTENLQEAMDHNTAELEIELEDAETRNDAGDPAELAYGPPYPSGT